MSYLTAPLWHQLVHSEIISPSRYIEYEREFYQNLLQKQPNKDILERDIYCLLGCFVWFGREIFINVRLEGPRTIEEGTLLILMARYQIEYPIFYNKRQYDIRNITEVASYFPFYVAEHLHCDRGSLFGNLISLPRCLAFESARGIIPRNSEWDPLFIRWKIWKTLLSAGGQEYQFSHKYVIPAPRTHLSIDNKIDIMRLFNISAPKLCDVLQQISNILIAYGYVAIENGFVLPRNFYRKNSILTSNLEDLKKFYEENITLEGATRPSYMKRNVITPFFTLGD